MLILIKVLTACAMPLGFSVLLLIVSVIFSLRNKKYPALLALIVATLWLTAFSTPYIANQIGRSLEARYPATAPELVAQTYPRIPIIVVLGGGIAGATHSSYRPWPDLNEASDRVWYASRLFKAYQKAGKHFPKVLLSGGNLEPNTFKQTEAQAMSQFSDDLGVPKEFILQEGTSRTTDENAANSAELLAKIGVKEIILVTSATHMTRAAQLFEKQGLTVHPVATDHRYAPKSAHAMQFIPSVEALTKSTVALKEWLWLWLHPNRNQ